MYEKRIKTNGHTYEDYVIENVEYWENIEYGGKWSFDKENRKKLPNDMIKYEDIIINNDEYTIEAIKFVDFVIVNKMRIASI